MGAQPTYLLATALARIGAKQGTNAAFVEGFFDAGAGRKISVRLSDGTASLILAGAELEQGEQSATIPIRFAEALLAVAPYQIEYTSTAVSLGQMHAASTTSPGPQCWP